MLRQPFMETLWHWTNHRKRKVCCMPEPTMDWCRFLIMTANPGANHKRSRVFLQIRASTCLRLHYSTKTKSTPCLTTTVRAILNRMFSKVQTKEKHGFQLVQTCRKEVRFTVSNKISPIRICCLSERNSEHISPTTTEKHGQNSVVFLPRRFIIWIFRNAKMTWWQLRSGEVFTYWTTIRHCAI